MKEQISGVRENYRHSTSEVRGEVQQEEGQTWMMIRDGEKEGLGEEGGGGGGGGGRRREGGGGRREKEGGAATQGRACLHSVWITESDVQKHSVQCVYAL